MTHKPEKNIFRDARLLFNTIGKALQNFYEGADPRGNLKIAENSLHELDMSVREIVDWGVRYAEAVQSITNNNVTKALINSDLKSAESFFEGTVRDTLEQEQAEAEQRYYKDRRINAQCDADNAKNEEFCGPDGKGESE